jgi:hypothetical protein
MWEDTRGRGREDDNEMPLTRRDEEMKRRRENKLLKG